jgi:CubicO group peptidase (beta-lactamase class C family)
MPGFGHAGLGGSVGWADPASGLAFGFVHNRLLSPFVVVITPGSSRQARCSGGVPPRPGNTGTRGWPTSVRPSPSREPLPANRSTNVLEPEADL